MPLLILPLFLAFCFFAAPPSWAEEAAECPEFQVPQVIITPLIVEPKLDVSRPLSSLLSMARENSEQYSSTRHELPVGLTAASLHLDSSYKITTHARRTNAPVCAQISSFYLRFGFEDTIIYLARELPPGSCGYRAVLAHEMEHVAIDRRFIQAYANHIPALLHEAIRQIGVVRASSAEAAEGKIRDLMTNYLGDLGKNLAAVREKQQLQIDTKDEYSRLSKTCDGQLGNLVGHYVRGQN